MLQKRVYYIHTSHNAVIALPVEMLASAGSLARNNGFKRCSLFVYREARRDNAEVVDPSQLLNWATRLKMAAELKLRAAQELYRRYRQNPPPMTTPKAKAIPA